MTGDYDGLLTGNQAGREILRDAARSAWAAAQNDIGGW